jgi:parvulin-like peptidyl-prolyl isomerase
MKIKNYKILENRPELTKEQVMLGMNFSSIQAKISNPSMMSVHKVFPLKTIIITGITSIIIISGTFTYNKYANSKTGNAATSVTNSAKTSNNIASETNTPKTPEIKKEAPKPIKNKTAHVKQVQPEDEEKRKAKEEAFIKSIAESLKLIESYRQRVIDGESMSDLAKQYSEDPGSAKNGGRYDDVDPNQLVPEFRDVALSLKPNEISIVFKTQYGFHFMQLIEHKGKLISFRHILVIPKVPPD